MLAEVHVEAHAKNGICVSFNNGVYRGSIDEDHVGGHRGVEDGWKSQRMMEKGNNDGDSGSNDPTMWWKGVFKGKHAKVRHAVYHGANKNWLNFIFQACYAV